MDDEQEQNRIKQGRLSSFSTIFAIKMHYFGINFLAVVRKFLQPFVQRNLSFSPRFIAKRPRSRGNPPPPDFDFGTSSLVTKGTFERDLEESGFFASKLTSDNIRSVYDHSEQEEIPVGCG